MLINQRISIEWRFWFCFASVSQVPEEQNTHNIRKLYMHVCTYCTAWWTKDLAQKLSEKAGFRSTCQWKCWTIPASAWFVVGFFFPCNYVSAELLMQHKSTWKAPGSLRTNVHTHSGYVMILMDWDWIEYIFRSARQICPASRLRHRNAKHKELLMGQVSPLALSCKWIFLAERALLSTERGSPHCSECSWVVSQLKSSFCHELCFFQS